MSYENIMLLSGIVLGALSATLVMLLIYLFMDIRNERRHSEELDKMHDFVGYAVDALRHGKTREVIVPSEIIIGDLRNYVGRSRYFVGPNKAGKIVMRMVPRR